MRILVIDDDRLTLVAVSRELKSEGHEVSTLEDGIKALSIIKDKNFDLIISDIMMPGISGLEMLNILKHFHLNQIPVILISSLHEKDLISESLSMGAFDFVVKPINFNELLKKISSIGQNVKTKP